MSDTGTRPAADLAPPDVTNGERVLAFLSIGFAVLLIGIAIDMLTGGKISGIWPVTPPATGDDSA